MIKTAERRDTLYEKDERGRLYSVNSRKLVEKFKSEDRSLEKNLVVGGREKRSIDGGFRINALKYIAETVSVMRKRFGNASSKYNKRLRKIFPKNKWKGIRIASRVRGQKLNTVYLEDLFIGGKRSSPCTTKEACNMYLEACGIHDNEIGSGMEEEKLFHLRQKIDFSLVYKNFVERKKQK